MHNNFKAFHKKISKNISKTLNLNLFVFNFCLEFGLDGQDERSKALNSAKPNSHVIAYFLLGG